MKKKITDTDRLKALAEIHSEPAGTDFEQMLFFAREKKKTTLAIYRVALNTWIRDGR